MLPHKNDFVKAGNTKNPAKISQDLLILIFLFLCVLPHKKQNLHTADFGQIEAARFITVLFLRSARHIYLYEQEKSYFT